MGLDVGQKVKFATSWTAASFAEPTPIGESIQAGLLVAAAWQAMCDPVRCQLDRDFAMTMEPSVPPAWPKATQASCRGLLKCDGQSDVIASLDLAARLQAELTSFEHCVLRTIFRRHTAHVEGDASSKAIQEAHLRSLKERFGKAQKAANTAWKKLIGLIKKRGIVGVRLSQQQIDRAKEHIWKHGFPRHEVILMRSFGASDFDVHWLRLVQRIHPDTGPVSLVDMLEGMLMINRSRDIQACACEE